MIPRAHVFAFMLPPRDSTRPVRVFWQRDLAAVIEILAALREDGYGIGEVLLNHPPEGPLAVPAERAEVDVSRLEPEDLLVTATRIPLSDLEHGDAKQVRRGWTTLEDTLLELWRRYLDGIARTRVRLAEPLRGKLPHGYEDRREMAFRSRECAFYKERNAHDGAGWRKVSGERRTAAFLLRVPELWPGGPGYLGVFGMDGTSTLIWAWQLRHRAPRLLRQPGFVMAELCGGPLPKRSTDYTWMDRWAMEVVLQHTL